MSGFDYGNARLRAMRSRLLSVKDLELLAESGTLQAMTVGLTRTAYRKAIEAALAHVSGIESINQALNADMRDTLGMVHRFYTDETGNDIGIILLAYDIQNIKTILRGLSRNISAPDILKALIPIGGLEYAALTDLARAPQTRAAIDLLASQGSPLAIPLIELRSELPGADISRMELALDQWIFRHAREYLQNTSQQGSILAAAFDLEADLVNMLTLLRFAHSPAERKLLHAWLGVEDLQAAFITPGTIPLGTLLLAASQDTLDAAVSLLAGTPYETYLRSGLESFTKTGRLSDLEKQVRRYRLEWLAQLFARNPLGAGVILAYFALKINEVGNLRWIAQGINLGIDPKAIRSELVLLS